MQWAFLPDTSALVAGQSVIITVQAQDQYSNRVMSNTKSISVKALGSSSGTQLIAPIPNPTLLTMISGQRTFPLETVIAETITLSLIDSQVTGYSVTSPYSTLTLDAQPGLSEVVVLHSLILSRRRNRRRSHRRACLRHCGGSHFGHVPNK